MYQMGNGHLLCLDCAHKAQQIFQATDTAIKQHLNFLLDQADAITGISAGLPRYKVQQPIVHQGPLNFHNIKVDNSVVGAINTSTVRLMEVALNNVHINNRNDELEGLLKQIAEAVLQDKVTSAEIKNDILAQLSVLTTVAAKPKESRPSAIVKALLTSIAVNLPQNLIEHWDKVKTLFGY